MVMNHLTTAPGHTYTYDNAGNLVSDNNGTTITTYTYDYRNRLTEVTQGGTVVATYTYNALNQRIGIKDSGTQTWTVYSGSSADAHPYADFNGSGGLTMRYLSAPGAFDGTLTSVILARTSSGGTIAWYLTDRLGSVRDIANTSGTVLDHIVYDSFGNVVTQTHATNGDRFLFAGMEYDSVTGQYFDRSRWYSPVDGRFASQDPTGFRAGDMDLYRYVGNDVPTSVDPNGDGSVTSIQPPPTPPGAATMTFTPGHYPGADFGLGGGAGVSEQYLGGPMSIIYNISLQQGMSATEKADGTLGFVQTGPAGLSEVTIWLKSEPQDSILALMPIHHDPMFGGGYQYLNGNIFIEEKKRMELEYAWPWPDPMGALGDGQSNSAGSGQSGPPWSSAGGVNWSPGDPYRTYVSNPVPDPTSVVLLGVAFVLLLCVL